MKNILLIGIGRFGKHLAIHLNQLGHQVMAIDSDEERINSVLEYVTSSEIGNATDENFLNTLGVSNYDICIVAIGSDFQSSLETTSLLKDLGAKYIVSRAEQDVQEKFLLRNGADDVIYPEKQVAKWASIRYTSDHVLGYVEVDDSHGIFEVEIPEDWIGKTIGDLDIRKKFGLNITALKTDGHLNTDIMADTLLTDNMTMLIIGELKQLHKVLHI